MGLASGTRLGPYQILSPLGAGGMGEVYRARDLKLKRDVAIKVLPEALARDEEALARFETEALAVAALSHPSILSIHDFGTEAGITYAVMELLEGDTLRQRLDAGPIPVRQAIDIALQIARGLAAAHERGVVHRDLKPENLVVSPDGHVKILDFGLAKRLDPEVSSGSETSAPTVSGLTAPRTLMGTMGYMSPEQIRGQEVDERSDLFSFGAVFYEMLAGRRAFRGESGADTMAAILMLEPPEMSLSGRSIPPALDHVVRRCLAKLPEGRFATAREVVAELREAARTFASGTVSAIGPKEKGTPPERRVPRVALGIAALVVAAALTVLGLRAVIERDAPPAPAGGPLRLAVLPFENLGAPEDDYFADGIADEVRGKLTTLPGVEVIARGSSVPYRKTAKSPSVIARELRVRYLLTATVRWEKGAGAGRVHVSPELVEVAGGGAPASRWQQTFEAELTGVFRVQADIAARVAGALGVALGTVAEARLNERPTKNVAAYDAFLRAEAASSSLGATDPPSLRKAIALYEEAVELDPAFALAWARLSRALVHLHSNSVPSPELLERARKAGARAVELAPGRPEGYLAQSSYEGLVRGDFVRELELLEKGQRLGLANAEVLTAAALAEQSLGRWHDTLGHLLQAEKLDPRSVLTKRRLALAYLLLRRFREARNVIEQGLAIAPASLALLEQRVMVNLLEGDVAGAKAAVAESTRAADEKALIAHLVNYQYLEWLLDENQRRLLLELPPAAFDDDRGSWGLHLAIGHALGPDRAKGPVRAEVGSYAEEARKAFEDQLRMAPDEPERLALLGLSLAYLGRKEDAIRAAERAAELRPVALDAYGGPLIQHQVVRIYLLVGEADKALDHLEPLLKIPYTLTAAWLRVDPTFAPLRGHPRFEDLAAVTP